MAKKCLILSDKNFEQKLLPKLNKFEQKLLPKLNKEYYKK